MPSSFLLRQLALHNIVSRSWRIQNRLFSEEIVRIGNISKPVHPPKHPYLVPSGFLPPGGITAISESLAQHLRWCMQKDILRQDMFLVGGAGPARRAVALTYCELTRREVEYLSLSRDTTESELKQRREIVDGSGVYVDQAAVRAALEGRILVLDGIERAERNVLPLLHNLLENREMRLEDGRVLLAPDRFDKLKADLSADIVREMGLERVSEEFRVIALGLPVPPYRGHTLDPPLRSRFQARLIPEIPYRELLTSITHSLPQLASNEATNFLSLLYTLHRMNTTDTSKDPNTDIPFHQVVSMLRDVESGITNYTEALEYLLPLQRYDSKLRDVVVSLRKRFDLPAHNSPPTQHEKIPNLHSNIVMTQHHTAVLADLERLCTAGDVAVVGSRGSGKSLLVDLLSRRLNKETTEIFCYKDMTARDLLQQRVTDVLTGNTGWKNAPLIDAAIRGRIAVLDGLHRLDPSTLASLQSLVVHRFTSLPDGSRLIPEEHYADLIKHSKLTQAELAERRVYPVHPDFRIIGISEPPPLTQATASKWLGSEALAMFRVKSLSDLTPAIELSIIHSLYPTLDGSVSLNQLIQLASALRENKNDTTSQSLAQSLSTRQLLRIAKRLIDTDTALVELIKKACLYRFLTPLARNTLEEQLARHHIHPTNSTTDTATDWSRVRSVQKQTVEELALVPDILFYQNKQQERILSAMLADYTCGEHLLLVGNQGVGKNKLADELLQRLSRPREYIQLHRDSTVQSLTTQPVLREGRLEYLDSPLVRAVKQGYTLVVDEADKAPLHVSSVLKGLVEGRGINLPDGRRILPSRSLSSEADTQGIPVHPDFRMIVLANRPGFPFMGNNFFANMGDLFSTHTVDNPDFSSELSLIKSYAPSLSDDVTKRLLIVMQELRTMADDGELRYPYSTRESVAIAKHLAVFPEEGLANAVRNVFDFDSFDKDTQKRIIRVLHKHGIPLGASPSNVKLARHSPLPAARHFSTWSLSEQTRPPQIHLSYPLRTSSPFSLPVTDYTMDRSYHRGQNFTEIVASWSLPLSERNYISSITVAPSSNSDVTDSYLHMIGNNPITLYTMKLAQVSPVRREDTTNELSEDALLTSDLFYCYPHTRLGGWSPHFKLCPLSEPYSGQIVLFESFTNSWLWFDPINRTGKWLKIKTAVSKLANKFGIKMSEKEIKTVDCSENNRIYSYTNEDNVLYCFDFDSMQVHRQTFPFPIDSLIQLQKQKWLATSSNNAFLCTHRGSRDSSFPDTINSIDTANTEFIESADVFKCTRNDSNNSNRQLMFSNTNVYGGYSSCTSNKNPLYTYDRPSAAEPTSSAVLSHNRILLNMLPPNINNETTLEAVDLDNSTLTEFTLPKLDTESRSTISQKTADYLLAPVPNTDDVIVADVSGHVLQLELAPNSLETSLAAWREMVGTGGGESPRVSRERFSGEDVKYPKHGRVDPKNEPHVGGNTWAGGTGGRDTAGLGGKGGPYRLDAGHDVFQLSDEEKDSVPDSVKRAAREMGLKAFKERMREIEMSGHDAALYQQYLSKVRSQIAALKETLTALQNRGSERSWIRHQTTGDLDDSKLVDSISGEKNVFVRRGEEEREVGAPGSEAKQMRVVVDVSGSMYRFNSIDARMERSMESVLMVLEAFKGFEGKVQLEITGHSGDDSRVEFVSKSSVPANENERLLVLKKMLAHSQFCWSGDTTLEATERAVRELARQEGDQHYLVVLSDANFSRYGIDAGDYGDVLMSEPRVNAFVIFIGSLGDQATRLKDRLPAGKAYVCMDTKELPNILKQIFASSLE